MFIFELYELLTYAFLLLFNNVQINYPTSTLSFCLTINCLPNWSESVSGSVSDSFLTPWTLAHQAPLTMGFPREEYWSGWPFSSPGDHPYPGTEPRSSAGQADSSQSEPSGKPNWSSALIKPHLRPLLKKRRSEITAVKWFLVSQLTSFIFFPFVLISPFHKLLCNEAIRLTLII